jgi:hypothetical protein
VGFDLAHGGAVSLQALRVQGCLDVTGYDSARRFAAQAGKSLFKQESFSGSRRRHEVEGDYAAPVQPSPVLCGGNVVVFEKPGFNGDAAVVAMRPAGMVVVMMSPIAVAMGLPVVSGRSVASTVFAHTSFPVPGLHTPAFRLRSCVGRETAFTSRTDGKSRCAEKDKKCLRHGACCSRLYREVAVGNELTLLSNGRRSHEKCMAQSETSFFHVD